MKIRGPIVSVAEPRTVSTSSGERTLCEIDVRPDRGERDPVTVTLWGDWAETAEHAEPGMSLLVTEAAENDYRGETGYATSGDSWVVVEPDFLVDVTGIRSWVQCPRLYYLNKLSGIPLNYPVVKGTIVHEVFGDLLRGVDLETAVTDRVEEAGLELGLLGYDRVTVEDEVRRNAAAIEGWLAQGTLGDDDSWRSEFTLLSPTFGLKGRADALRRGSPVELKTGKNTNREPRFHDKIQAACYALMLEERGVDPELATLLYTKNTALDRSEASGDLSPAKEFTVGAGLLRFVVRERNALAAMEWRALHDSAARPTVPTGHEADATCAYCFEQDTCMVVSGRLDQESKAGQVGTPVPADERAYFDRFYVAIEEERRQTHAEYRKLWEQSPSERAADDRALIDLEPIAQTQVDDNRYELRARVPDDAVSKLREGDVALASDGSPVEGHAELCRITTLEDAVVVETDEPVELRRLDVYPSEISVDRMLTALHDAVLKGDERRKDVVFGRREPSFRDRSADGDRPTYVDNNAAQDAAVALAVDAEDCALIHGPPGTGKTYTIARTIRALVERGDRVLLAAFTNRAVDNAIEALRDQGFDDVCRIGSESGVRRDMHDLRLVERGDPDAKAAELRSAPVVAATTAACGSRVLRECSFDVALVDEASQLTEPSTHAAIALADRFVLVGDHQQLPPVVRAENDLERSLFERLIEAYPDASVLLDRQYRMSQRIQAFSSTAFYDGALRPATPSVARRSLADLADLDALPTGLDGGVTVVDPDGTRDGNRNVTEARQVAAIVDAYRAAGVDPEDIGVIAPFRAQVAEIGGRTDVTVDTVDRFQGSAKEVIVVSFVATGTLDGPIFEDHRRVNVALTRAKRQLTLVCDTDALASDPFYARMLEWARR